MAAPVDVPIPLGLVLGGGYTVRFTALDATTGNVVSNVIVSDASVQYDQVPQATPTIKNTAVFLPGPALE